MNKTSITKDLTSGNIALQLIGYIAPLFFSNVLQLVYSITDMAVVGHFVGKNGLAAISVMGEVITLLTYLAMGFANAGQVLISQYTGAGRHDKTRDFIGTFFSSIVLFSLVLTIIAVSLHNPIISGINVPAEMRTEARIYFLTCAAGFVFTFAYNAISAILRGMGDSRHPFVFVAVACVTNVVLDILFVVVFRIGIFGAAIATVISQCFSFILSARFMYRHRDKFGFDFRLRSFVIRRDSLKLIIKLGSPLALQGGLIQFVLILVARWINAYGVLIISITGIGNKLNSISQTFSSAVGTSASTMIGQCLGAKKYKRVIRATAISGCIAVGIASIWAGLLMLFPEAIFGIFTSDPEVLALVPTFLPVAILLVYSSSFRSPMNGLINGSGNPKMNLILAFVDGFIAHLGIPLLFGFVLDYGLMGLWYGNAGAAFTPFFLGLIYCISGRWKRVPSLVDRQLAEEK